MSEAALTDGDSLELLQSAFGHHFARRDLLEEALTHSSAAGEGQPSLERLEFLGDRVLGLIVAGLLLRRFPDEDQGLLALRHARLVSHGTLVEIARELSLGAYIRVRAGVASGDGELPPSILEDALEAVLGAVYLDGGLEPATRLIETHWAGLLTETPPRDAKTELQEWVQARGLKLPNYEIIATAGPPHAPVFTVGLSVDGLPSVSGRGSSKRTAERAAASTMLACAKRQDG